MTRFRPVNLEGFSFQPPVLDFLAAPPASPAEGDRYVVLAPAIGAWLGQETKIAWYFNAAWRFDVPAVGWMLNNTADNTLYKFNGTAWISLAAPVYFFDLEGGFPASIYGGIWPIEGGTPASIYGGTSGIDGGSP